MKRPKPGEQWGPADAPFVDEAFAKEFPTIHKYLTVRNWEDGSPRTTSTLLIFLDQGVLRVCINDRDLSRSCFFTGETFDEALRSLENALLSERVEWRNKTGGPSGSQRTPF